MHITFGLLKCVAYNYQLARMKFRGSCHYQTRKTETFSFCIFKIGSSVELLGNLHLVKTTVEHQATKSRFFIKISIYDFQVYHSIAVKILSSEFLSVHLKL